MKSSSPIQRTVLRPTLRFSRGDILPVVGLPAALVPCVLMVATTLAGCSTARAPSAERNEGRDEPRVSAPRARLAGSVVMQVAAYACPERTLSVSPAGALRSIETWPDGQRNLRTGRLSQEQLRHLAELLEGWDALETSYPGTSVPDGPEYSITYAGKTVTAGDASPKPFTRLQRMMTSLANKAAPAGRSAR